MSQADTSPVPLYRPITSNKGEQGVLLCFPALANCQPSEPLLAGGTCGDSLRSGPCMSSYTSVRHDSKALCKRWWGRPKALGQRREGIRDGCADEGHQFVIVPLPHSQEVTTSAPHLKRMQICASSSTGHVLQ